jgi:hypothetical protein
MTATPSGVSVDEAADVAEFSAELTIDGVPRQVTLRVSPRPTSPTGWAEVVLAVTDFVRGHPERFS